MSGFQLDTSGFVAVPPKDKWELASCDTYHWSDLDAFTQGYIEALFDSLKDQTHTTGWAFRYLAAETLARIIEDCGARLKSGFPGGSYAGREFWKARQDPRHQKGAREGNRYWDSIADFPPLTVTLGDDGKVYLTEQVPA